MGAHCEIGQGRGVEGVAGWHPDSPLADPASFIEAFSGTLIPPDVFKGLLGDSERTEF